ncbi:MAG: DUF2231 domain-containing protein [Fimbriimonadaceae bacterium]|nr:DUF2231 domain-containing protein [Fimbriimonadaceae bacterium]
MKTSVHLWVRTATVALTAIVLTGLAHAKPEFWKEYQEVQTMEPRTRMVAAECRNCHTSPPRRNPFGQQVDRAMRAAGEEKVTAALLASIAKEDADGDGATNEEEWKADTLPGDPESKPGSAGTGPVDANPEFKPADPVENLDVPDRPTPGAAGPGTPSSQSSAGGQGASEPDDGGFGQNGGPGVAAAPARESGRGNQGGGGMSAVAADPAEPDRLVPDHAFHPAFVHFPIALFMVGVVVDVIGRFKRNEIMREVGWWNMVIGTIAGLLAIISGLVARTFIGYDWGEPTFFLHFVLAVASMLLMLVSVGLRKSAHKDSLVYVLTAVVGAILVGAAGHFGSVLVYG